MCIRDRFEMAGTYYSKEVCDAFAAAEAARKAEIEALKTCSPSVNCVNPDSGHACQVRVDSNGDNEYYCNIRAFVDGDGSSATSDNPDGIFNGLTPMESSSCTDVDLVDGSDPAVYESLEICATYGAKVEAGLTCVADADCDTNGCQLDTDDNNYKCVLTRETACTDVETDDQGVSRSKEVCDAFAAKKEAEFAAILAKRTCEPSKNCEDPTSGHACQVRVQTDGVTGEESNQYYCMIKVFTDAEPGTQDENPDGMFTGLTVNEVSSCGDVSLSGESISICEAYGAMAEAGYTCVEEADCLTDGDGNKCTGSLDTFFSCNVNQGETACTDVEETADGSGVYRSKEICDAFAGMAAAAAAEAEAKKTCAPEFNCQVVAGTEQFNGCILDVADDPDTADTDESSGHPGHKPDKGMYCIVGTRSDDSDHAYNLSLIHI